MMKLERFRILDGQKLRYGYTTGSCAAAAAKAAAFMLLTGKEINEVKLVTPAGIPLTLEVLDVSRTASSVSCAIRKDAGDDPDATDGALVYAEVCFREEGGVFIEGGPGVGRVTKPGLDQPVGNAAINSVPRKMITEALMEVWEMFRAKEPPRKEEEKGFKVTIRIPDGEELAKKTFNPKLGIVGGISVLGTTGIVTPMSEEALLATIRTEIQMRRAEGLPILPMAPGNYGRAFFQEKYGFSLDLAVETSNFIADALFMAQAQGFSRILFIGHIGKMIKVAGGIRNTHSKYGDHRMEILLQITEEVLPGKLSQKGREEIQKAVSMDEAIRLLKEKTMDGAVLREVTGRVKRHLEEFAGGGVHVETVIFSNLYGALGSTEQVEAYMEELKAYEEA